MGHGIIKRMEVQRWGNKSLIGEDMKILSRKTRKTLKSFFASSEDCDKEWKETCWYVDEWNYSKQWIYMEISEIVFTQVDWKITNFPRNLLLIMSMKRNKFNVKVHVKHNATGWKRRAPRELSSLSFPSELGEDFPRLRVTIFIYSIGTDTTHRQLSSIRGSETIKKLFQIEA